LAGPGGKRGTPGGAESASLPRIPAVRARPPRRDAALSSEDPERSGPCGHLRLSEEPAPPAGAGNYSAAFALSGRTTHAPQRSARRSHVPTSPIRHPSPPPTSPPAHLPPPPPPP